MTVDNPSSPPVGSWREIIWREIVEYLVNLAFLSFFLVSFAWYRRLVLAEYHIDYAQYWMPIVEAAILAKVIMIGDILRMARGLRRWPLAVPTIYRAITFSLFVVGCAVLEHVVGALLHGRRAADGLAELTNKGWYEILAWYVLVVVVLLPFFAFKEIERTFGRSTVRRLFFVSGVQGLTGTAGRDGGDPGADPGRGGLSGRGPRPGAPLAGTGERPDAGAGE